VRSLPFPVVLVASLICHSDAATAVPLIRGALGRGCGGRASEALLAAVAALKRLAADVFHRSPAGRYTFLLFDHRRCLDLN